MDESKRDDRNMTRAERIEILKRQCKFDGINVGRYAPEVQACIDEGEEWTPSKRQLQVQIAILHRLELLQLTLADSLERIGPAQVP